jgi:hypothetical protein
MSIKIIQSFAFLALSSLLALPAAAQQAAGTSAELVLGTPSALGSGPGALARPMADVEIGRVAPARVFRNASFGTGAVGLRNRGGGGIEVSGASGEIKAAFLYWAVITQGEPNAAVSSVLLRQRISRGEFTRIRGTVVGKGPSPCWLGDRITVFRGAVPLSLATGNAHYRIELLDGGSGRRDGADPWVSSPLPLMGGASLVLIGTGSQTIALYDKGLAGRTFYPRLSYALELPVTARGADQVIFHNIGADGQIGVSTRAFAQTARDVMSIGDPPRPIAGPGSAVNDSAWNGAIAGPLPQLWDNTTHDVTAEAAAAKVAGIMPVRVSAPDDCLTPVANLVAIR